MVHFSHNSYIAWHQAASEAISLSRSFKFQSQHCYDIQMLILEGKTVTSFTMNWLFAGNCVKRSFFAILYGLFVALSAPLHLDAQMSLPSPQDKFSFPSRRDFLWDGFNVVVIDPGHGGENTGAVGPGGLKEKDFTLNLAKKLQRMLIERLGVKAYLTRERDEAVPDVDRTALANHRSADLFISLHAGAGFKREATGTVVCFYLEDTSITASSSSKDTEDFLVSWRWDRAHQWHRQESAEFAGILARKVGPLFKGEYRGVPEGIIHVLRGAAMPAALVEVASITAPYDESVLSKEETLEALSSAITEAVSVFKRRVEGGAVQPETQ